MSTMEPDYIDAIRIAPSDTAVGLTQENLRITDSAIENGNSSRHLNVASEIASNQNFGRLNKLGELSDSFRYKESANTTKYNNLGTIIRQLSKLEYGWDTYCAEAPSKSAVQRALDFLDLLFYSYSISPDKVGASPDGGIVFTGTRGDMYFLLEFCNECEGSEDNVFLWRRGIKLAKSREFTIDQFDRFAQAIYSIHLYS